MACSKTQSNQTVATDHSKNDPKLLVTDQLEKNDSESSSGLNPIISIEGPLALSVGTGLVLGKIKNSINHANESQVKTCLLTMSPQMNKLQVEKKCAQNLSSEENQNDLLDFCQKNKLYMMVQNDLKEVNCKTSIDAKESNYLLLDLGADRNISEEISSELAKSNSTIENLPSKNLLVSSYQTIKNGDDILVKFVTKECRMESDIGPELSASQDIKALLKKSFSIKIVDQNNPREFCLTENDLDHSFVSNAKNPQEKMPIRLKLVQMMEQQKMSFWQKIQQINQDKNAEILTATENQNDDLPSFFKYKKTLHSYEILCLNDSYSWTKEMKKSIQSKGRFLNYQEFLPFSLPQKNTSLKIEFVQKSPFQSEVQVKTEDVITYRPYQLYSRGFLARAEHPVLIDLTEQSKKYLPICSEN